MSRSAALMEGSPGFLHRTRSWATANRPHPHSGASTSTRVAALRSTPGRSLLGATTLRQASVHAASAWRTATATIPSTTVTTGGQRETSPDELDAQFQADELGDLSMGWAVAPGVAGDGVGNPGRVAADL